MPHKRNDLFVYNIAYNNSTSADQLELQENTSYQFRAVQFKSVGVGGTEGFLKGGEGLIPNYFFPFDYI